MEEVGLNEEVKEEIGWQVAFVTLQKAAQSEIKEKYATLIDVECFLSESWFHRLNAHDRHCGILFDMI